MRGKILGEIAQPGGAPEACEGFGQDSGMRAFADGYAEYAESVNVKEENDALCLAWGEPRFVDAPAKALAEAQGDAAAWLAGLLRHGA